MKNFIDFLDVNSRKSIEQDLIVFYGCSGSGKSTQIKNFLARYVNKNKIKYSMASASTINWHEVLESKPQKLIVIDEINQVSELKYIFRLLKRGHKLIVASHVRPLWFLLFRMKYQLKIYNLDNYTCKLSLRLDQLGLQYSPLALKYYVRNYGSSFTGIEIITERYAGCDFDKALRYFRKFNQVATRRVARPQSYENID